MSGGRGGFVPVSSSPHASPHNMIDAISEIQQYHIIERTGQDIPSDFLTMRGTLTFFLVGVRSGFWEGAFLALLLPLAWGVWEEVIPAFGGASDLFGKCLVFLFGFGISLMMTVVFLEGYLRGTTGGTSRERPLTRLFGEGRLAWWRMGSLYFWCLT